MTSPESQNQILVLPVFCVPSLLDSGPERRVQELRVKGVRCRFKGCAHANSVTNEVQVPGSGG